MLLKATRSQIRFLLRQKAAIFTFCVLLAIVLMNYTKNILDFKGWDVLAMYHPMKLLVLSFNRTDYNADIMLLLVQLYPLLVSIPAGLSLARERQTGEDVMIAAHIGSNVYLWSTLLAVMLVTAIIFSLPFLLEIILNCIAFPTQATGDLTNWDVFQQERIDDFNRYLFKNLYLFSPYLYAVLCTLLFGVVSGIGSGKTMLFRALSGLMSVTSGEITWGGKVLRQDFPFCPA